MIVKTFHEKNRERNGNIDEPQVKTFHNKSSTVTPIPEPIQPTIKRFDGVTTKSESPTPPEPKRFDGVTTKVSTPKPQNTTVAKPMFKPAVKLSLDETESQVINNCLSKLGFTDFNMTDMEKSRILFLKDEIKILDHGYIGNYGSDINSDESLDKLTKISQCQASTELREMLKKIMESISMIDMENFTEERTSLMKFFGKKTIRKEDFPEFVKTLKADINKCKSHLDVLQKTVPLFDAVDDETEKQFRFLSVMIVAGQLRIEKEKEKLDLDELKDGDFFTKQTIKDGRDAISRFERRVHNLILIRQTMLMRMGQLRLEQKNVLSLIDQAQDIVQMVIPTWLQHMLTLSAAKNSQTTEFYETLANSQKMLHNKLTNITGEN